MRAILLAVVSVILVANNVPASAEVLAECGPFEGYGYFFEGAFVPKDKAGWTKDKIGSGSTSITEVDGKIDVIFSDVSVKNSSSSDNEVKVFMIGGNREAGIITIFVDYRGTSTEIYTYNAKMRKLVLLATKYNTLVNKSTMMVSDCK